MIAWLGHLERVEEHRLTQKITKWKPIAFRLRGRPKMKWEDDVKQDLKCYEDLLLEKEGVET
jgi:hypothetical protein